MKSWLCACLAVGLMGIAGCGDNNPIEELDEASDCNAICKRYQDCFDKSYDTDKCQSNCRDRADDSDHKDQEERCSDCIDGASCGGAAFSCATDCLGIVP